jgi:hypothetical protein
MSCLAGFLHEVPFDNSPLPSQKLDCHRGSITTRLRLKAPFVLPFLQIFWHWTRWPWSVFSDSLIMCYARIYYITVVVWMCVLLNSNNSTILFKPKFWVGRCSLWPDQGVLQCLITVSEENNKTFLWILPNLNCEFSLFVFGCFRDFRILRRFQILYCINFFGIVQFFKQYGFVTRLYWLTSLYFRASKVINIYRYMIFMFCHESWAWMTWFSWSLLMAYD